MRIAFRFCSIDIVSKVSANDFKRVLSMSNSSFDRLVSVKTPFSFSSFLFESSISLRSTFMCSAMYSTVSLSDIRPRFLISLSSSFVLSEISFFRFSIEVLNSALCCVILDLDFSSCRINWLSFSASFLISSHTALSKTFPFGFCMSQLFRRLFSFVSQR